MFGCVFYVWFFLFEEVLGCIQIDWIDGFEWVDD